MDEAVALVAIIDDLKWTDAQASRGLAKTFAAAKAYGCSYGPEVDDSIRRVRSAAFPLAGPRPITSIPAVAEAMRRG